MSFLNYFAKCFGISKARKGHIEASEAAKVAKRMMDLSEQRARDGNHQRASPQPTAPLILSNSTHDSSAIASDFATKKGSRFDRMEVDNNLDTFSMFQKMFSPDAPQAVIYRDSSLSSLSMTAASSSDFASWDMAKTKPKDTCASESLILPVPNRHSREQLRFWQAVGATSGF